MMKSPEEKARLIKVRDGVIGKKNRPPPPSKLERLKTMALGMVEDAKEGIKDMVPSRNREVTELYRKKIDRHVDGNKE